MTWFLKQGGYELFFNRDEQLSRSRASKPHVHNEESISYIAPIDNDAGGTWIATNQYGVTVCLLNHYQFQQIETYKKWISRGKIVQEFSNSVIVAQAIRKFKSLLLDDYRAFRMFIIEPNGSNALLIWDGHTPRVEMNTRGPKTSSSVDAQHVKSYRKQYYHDLGLSMNKQRQSFIRYHASHYPQRAKESVCMHREDASTVSFSHIDVTEKNIQFYYADGAPCCTKIDAPIVLETKITDINTVQIATC